jgi:hypothetical protein
MRVLKILAVSLLVQSVVGGAEEKTKPGRDGTTTLKATFFPMEVTADSVNGLITGRNLWKEPVQIISMNPT